LFSSSWICKNSNNRGMKSFQPRWS
jgi:hypothetical protein